MVHGRTTFLIRLARRIRIEEYSNQVEDILRMGQNFVHHFQAGTINKDNEYDLGTVSFMVNNRAVPIQIMGFYDPGSNPATMNLPNIEGSIPSLRINFYYWAHLDPKDVPDKLRSTVVHEITHLLDFTKNPVYDTKFDPEDQFSDVLASFRNIIERMTSSPAIQQKILQFSVEKVAKSSAMRVMHSKHFQNILKQHQVVLDDLLVRKLLKLAEDIFVMKYTTPPKNLSEISDPAKNYYNSEAEMKAYLTQVIHEMDAALTPNDLSKLKSDKTKISSNIDFYLDKSQMFRGIRKFLNTSNLRKFYYEAANFLSQKVDAFNPPDNQ